MTARRRRPYRASRTLLLNRAAILLALFLVIAVIRLWTARRQPPASPETLAEGVHLVQRVVDGDTLLLENNARIRLIGVDAPESVKPNSPVEPFGPEAKQFTQWFVDEAGGQVRLQFDRERLDKYGRFLAYVWSDSRMLNEELIRAGLATAELQYRYASTVKNRLRRAEAEARSAGRGIWSNRSADRRAA